MKIAIKDRPFKLALCLFAVYSGISGLFDFGTSNEIFSAAIKFSSVFNILFILAGVTAMIGVLKTKLNIEAAGLVLIITSLLLRVMATVAISGWDPGAHNLLALSVLFISASLSRINTILGILNRTHVESSH